MKPFWWRESLDDDARQNRALWRRIQRDEVFKQQSVNEDVAAAYLAK